MTDDRARGVHEVFTSRVLDWIILCVVAIAGADVVLATFFGTRLEVVVPLGAVVLSLLARPLRRSALTNVNAGFARREIQPLQQREASVRRDTRQKQFAVVALCGFIVFRVLAVVSERTSETWLTVPAVVAAVVAVVAGLALVWSLAWRFGDERPQ